MDLSPQHVQVRHSEQMRDEKKASANFSSSLDEIADLKNDKT
jgi:hypothetical protein